jgi:hypothetical protein
LAAAVSIMVSISLYFLIADIEIFVFSMKHVPVGGKLKFEWMVGIEVLVAFLLVGLRYISMEGRSFAY